MTHPNQPPQPNPNTHNQYAQPQGGQESMMPVAPMANAEGHAARNESMQSGIALHLGKSSVAEAFSQRDGKGHEATFHAIPFEDEHGNYAKHMKVSRMNGPDAYGRPIHHYEELSLDEQSAVKEQAKALDTAHVKRVLRHIKEMDDMDAQTARVDVSSMHNGLTAADRTARGAANRIVAQQKMQELQAAREAQQQREREQRAQANRQQAAAELARLQSLRALQQSMQTGQQSANMSKAPEQRSLQPAPTVEGSPSRVVASTGSQNTPPPTGSKAPGTESLHDNKEAGRPQPVEEQAPSTFFREKAEVSAAVEQDMPYDITQHRDKVIKAKGRQYQEEPKEEELQEPQEQERPRQRSRSEEIRVEPEEEEELPTETPNVAPATIGGYDEDPKEIFQGLQATTEFNPGDAPVGRVDRSNTRRPKPPVTWRPKKRIHEGDL